MSQLCYNCFKEYNAPGPCPHCGFDAAAEKRQPLSLHGGVILGGRYIVGRVLGEGGFGITYAAQDYDSKQLVAIKEHFPAAIVTRTNHIVVSLIDEKMRDAFLEGKDKFLTEAKTLSQFNGLSNICDIYSYFEENGTAYFAMEYVNGIPLDKYIRKLGRMLSFEEAARLLLPVMDALSHVHSHGIIHRDIAPDNIMVSPEGKVMLIDFGAARYSMGEKSRSLDVILKHGFAPREQYNRHGRQGAYTDVYAMGATFYFCITGKVPQDSLDRMDNDELLPPSKLNIKIPRRAEAALLKALAVNPPQRWQSMGEFAGVMKGELSELERLERLRVEEQKLQKELDEKARFEKEQREKLQAEREEKKRLDAEARKAKQLEKEEKKRRKTEDRNEAQEKASAEIKDGRKKTIALIAALTALAIVTGAFFAIGVDKESTSSAGNGANIGIISEHLEKTDNAVEVQWTFSEHGVLTLSGNGRMADYESLESIPWADKRDQIEEVVIEDGITGIGDRVFQKHRNLRKVYIKGQLDRIGRNAFAGCSALELIDFSGEVKLIDSHAFNGCSSLESFHFVDGLESIGESSFQNCNNLKEVVLPSTLNSIKSQAFMNCVNLKLVQIPEGITVIPYRTFSGCSNLETVYLPSSLSDIETYAFVLCGDFELYYAGTKEQWNKINLGEYNDLFPISNHSAPTTPEMIHIDTSPTSSSVSSNLSFELGTDGILRITGSGTLSDRSALEEYEGNVKRIDIGEGITGIGSNVFSGWSELTLITLPDSLTSIGEKAFYNCRSLAGTFIIPESVSIIGDSAFSGCRDITNINIPHDISRIGDSVFSGCRSLRSLTIPQGVTAIGDNAFENCSSIAGTVNIPASVTSIGDYAFDGCESISFIDIPASVTSIGNSAFQNCRSISRIYIPEGITSLGTSLFSGCESLVIIDLPDSLTSIGDYAFQNCSGLIRSFTLPEGVTKIGIGAFMGCDHLNHIEIPDSVTSIGNAAFSGCDFLTGEFIIPEGIRSVEGSLFFNCSSLSSIVLPESLTSIGPNAFSGCYSLSRIEIPASVTSIGSGAFNNCYSITAITIPEGVSAINQNTFYHCSVMRKISIPQSVTKIESSAFQNCSSLNGVEYHGNEVQWNDISIDSNNDPLLNAYLTFIG